MDANESRIGNIITDETGYPLVICTVCENIVIVHPYKDYPIHLAKSGGIRLPAEKIKPISLTPELLEGCGFCYMPDKYGIHAYTLYFGEDDEFRMIADASIMGGYRVNILQGGNYICPSAEYLHQLQNIYYVLTGKELEVKL